MGVDLSVLDFLMKFRGKVRGETLQLGKKGFHISKTQGDEERRLAEEIIRKYDPKTNFDEIAGSDGFTGNLFTYLGSSRVSSMDASAYEGADIIHDLNIPIPDLYESKFDVIFDGGTIEHIFNPPMAFENVKRMLKPGGLFLSVNAANNQLGHGFYQFSPELMWRMFSKQAGFRVELMQIVVLGGGLPDPFDAPDPDVAGGRVEIGSTAGPAYILVATTKIDTSNKNHLPMQSDYVARWASARDIQPGNYVPDTHNRR